MRKFTGGKWIRALVLVLAVCLLTPAAWASSGEGKGKREESKHAKTKLKDIEKHWAERDIEKMGARGFIKGYQDFSFRPGNGVSHQEVLVMLVRAMGLEQEAAAETSVQLNTRAGQQLAAWAAGYAAVAVDQGLVLPAELAVMIPNKPAKREEVAVYLARVLIWAKMNTLGRTGSVNFSDAGDITRELMAYVSPVYTWGLMLGDPERKFQPHRPVSRAEMAVILARLDALLENGQVAEQRVTGTLQVITTGQNPAVRIRKTDGSQVTAPVTTDASIYRDHRRVDLEDLKVGDLVEAVVNADGEVTFLEATAQNLIVQLEGVLKSLDLQDRTLKLTQSNGADAVYPLAAGVLVKLNGRTVALDYLEAGDRVKLSLRDGQGVKVEAKRTTTQVQGTVLSVTLAASPLLTIRESGGSSVTYTVYADAEVKLDGSPAALADIQPGYRVELKLQADRVVGISARSPDEVEVKGNVVSVSTGTTATITVRLNDGQQAAYPVAANADIEVDGDDARLSDIRPGDRVELEVSGGQVTKIDAETEYEVKGTIFSVVISATTQLVIDTNNGSRVTYTLAADADIEMNDEDDDEDEDQNGVVGDMQPGQRVKLEVRGDVITKVEAD